MMFVLVTGCSDSGTNPETSESAIPLSYSMDKIINSGDNLLQESVDSLSALSGSEIKTELKQAADYMLFPMDYSSFVPFSQRMAAVFTGSDNLEKVTSYLQQAANATVNPAYLPSSSTISVKKGRWIFAAIGAACSIIDTVNNWSKADATEQMANRLNAMNKTLEQFQAETRQSFGQVNDKLDQSITQLTSLKGDVNLMHNDLKQYFVDSQMQQIVDNFDAFIIGYQNDAKMIDAKTRAYNYFISATPGYWYDMLHFMTIASNAQTWANDNVNTSHYTDWVGDDPASSTNSTITKVHTVYYYHTAGPESSEYYDSYYYRYSNPKKQLVISLGNLDYLTKMMLTRLSMNAILYGGSVLKQNNATLAQQFLDKLQEKGIKSGLNSSLSNMQNEYDNRANYFPSEDYYPILTTYKHLKRFELYQDDVLVKTYLLSEKAELDAFLKSDYQNNVKEYLAIYAARYIALEVKLKSYL